MNLRTSYMYMGMLMLIGLTKFERKKSISFMFSYRSDVINGTTKQKKKVVLSSTKVK